MSDPDSGISLLVYVKVLRLLGVSTSMLAGAAGTKVATYGVEAIGFSNSHLLAARRPVASAASAHGGGKHHEMVLHIADASGTNIDPAMDAHVMPFKMWAQAYSQTWQAHKVMAEAAEHAFKEVIVQNIAVWNKVHGPAGALIASANRIGWTIWQGRFIRTDEGASLDFWLDPPIVIAKEVEHAVRRWRLERIGVLLPALIPKEPDIVVPPIAGLTAQPGHRDLLIDFTDVVGSLLSQKTSASKVFDLWDPCHKPSLRSAASGGQWTQARLAAVKAWEIDDNQCQLCQAAVGTLQHRLVCPCIVPTDGWQPPPSLAARALEKLAPDRSSLLATRGLLVVKARIPKVAAGESFQWITPMPEDAPDKLVWYIDGSMFDEKRRFGKALGFAIVVISGVGRVVAIASGCPPPFVTDAAGAELWAYKVVLGLNPFMPTVVTDCKGILDGLKAGANKISSPKLALARTWRLIANILEGNFKEAAESLTWMPAHTTVSSIGKALDSNGDTITPVMWRANRLVDAYAKLAARPKRLHTSVFKELAAFTQLVQHQAARLGYVTHMANHYEDTKVGDGGAVEAVIRRDTTATRPWKRKCVAPRQESAAPKPGADAAAFIKQVASGLAEAPAQASSRKSVRELSLTKSRRLTVARQVKRNRQAEDDAFVASSIGRLELKPASQSLTASERLQRVLLKGRAKRLGG